MTGKDLLFASLMGSTSFKTVERLGFVQNDLTVKELPNIPYLSTNTQLDRIPKINNISLFHFHFQKMAQNGLSHLNQ